MKNLYVIDDDDIFCDWFDEVIELFPNIAATKFFSAERFLGEIADLGSGVVFMDLRLPGLSGIEALAQYRHRLDHFPTVVMSSAGDIESAVSAMRFGAMDFLVKPCSERTLLEKAGAAFDRLDEQAFMLGLQDDHVARFARLSGRETDVLRLLIEGRANRHISDELGLSVRTVETYRGKLMAKLGVGSLAEAIKLAYACGFTELSVRASR